MNTNTIIELTAENFEATLAQVGTPVLVDFSATWCGPCQMLAPLLEELAREFDGRIQFAKVDIDAAPELAERFGITGVPTLLLFRQGQPADGMVGMGSPRALRAWLEKAAGEAPLKAEG